MEKKITRRIVLGTVIGGLVAGPFVIRELRSRNASLVDENEVEDVTHPPFITETRKKFFDAWKAEYEDTLVFPTTSSKPHEGTVTLKRDFSVPNRWSFHGLNTMLYRGASTLQECSAENILLYTTMCGTLHVKGGSSEALVVDIKKHERKFLSLNIKESQKGGVPIEEKRTGNNVSTVSMAQVTLDTKEQTLKKLQGLVEDIVTQHLGTGSFTLTHDFLPSDSNILLSERGSLEGSQNALFLCHDFCSRLKFPLPGKSLNMGDEYEFSPGEQIDQKTMMIRAKLERFVRIGGADAIEILPVFAKNAEDYGSIIYDRYLPLIEKTFSNEKEKSSFIAKLKNKIDRVKKDINKNVIDLKCYLLCDSGFVVNYEDTTKYNRSGKHGLSVITNAFNLKSDS